MAIDVDTLIFVSFLLVNLVVGLFYSRGVTTTTEYAIGNRNFSTGTIITTVVATTIGAGLFSTAISESYKQGLYFIIPAVLGDFISLIITGYFLIPRMGEFFGTLSVAEAMSNLYGKHVRIITAISGTLLSIGAVAMQFKVAASVLQVFFGISGFYALTISSTIVILYSSFGGIRAVTFTDTLQFFTFSTIVPLICVAIWQNNNVETSQVFFALSNNPLFDLKEVLNFSNPRFLSLVFLLCIFAVPLDPTYFQRISMSSGVYQARKSFVMSGVIVSMIMLIACWTGVLLFSNNPNLDSNNLLGYIINTYAYTGLKGLTVAGIMAIIMSTADSYINCASVLIEHDIVAPLKLKTFKPQQKLLLIRVIALCIGGFALILAVKTEGLLQLLLKTLSFYMPVVSVPLILAIFGFRSTPKVVMIGMLCGVTTVILCQVLEIYEDSEATLGMLANLIAFIISHWLSGKPKGSDNIIHKIALKQLKHNRKKNFYNLCSAVKNFNLIKFYKQHYIKQERFDVFIGLLAIVTVFSSLHFTSRNLQHVNFALFNFIYHSVLICGFILITNFSWPSSFRKSSFIITFKIISIPYILVFVPMLLVAITGFGQFHLMILLINAIAFILLTKWPLALCTLGLFGCMNIMLYGMLSDNRYIEAYDVNNSLHFGIAYILCFISATIFVLLKPQQEEQELSVEIIGHLSHEVEDQKQETCKAIELKNKFLRNLQHETNAPLTGVYSMSQALDELYDKLTDEQRKAAIHTIHSSSERLTSYFGNLIDLSKLRSLGYELKIAEVNLSKLLDYTLAKCQKLYISQDTQEDRDFVLAIEPDLKAECDEYYIGRAMENIITNAIQYCKKGRITITLEQTNNQNHNLNEHHNNILFTVKDSGIGIPNGDLNKIFDSFTTSSKTDTPAGGRGVGLALAKIAVELHGGKISCTSDRQNGCCFTLTLPVANQKLNANE